MLSSPLVGYATDHYSKRLLVLIGSFGRSIAYFIMYTAIILESLPGLALGTFSIGFGAGFFWIPFNTLTSEKSHKDHRSYAFGRRASEQGKGVMYGSIIGFNLMFILMSLTPNNLFLIFLPLPVYGLGNMYAGILFFKKVNENLKYDDQNDNAEPKSSFFSIPSVLLLATLLLFFVLFLSSVNGSLSRPFIQVYLLENITDDAFWAAMAYIPSGMVSMVLAPKLGDIADRINPFLGISVASLIGAFITWELINATNLAIFASLLIIDSTVVYTASLILTNIISRISKDHRGKIFGLNSSISNSGAIAGPVLGGIVWDSLGQRAPFLFSIFVEVALIPVYLLAIFLIRPYLAEKIESEATQETETPSIS